MMAAAVMLPLAGCVGPGQIEGALRNAGLSPSTSQCIAHRLTEQLSRHQLRSLAALGNRARSVDGYIAAVQRLNDPRATRVAIGSAALCVAGLD